MLDSLWPEIEPAAARPPVSILKEQGTLLGSKTNNLVEGKVESIPEPDEATMGYSFYIVAPVLGGYRYRLFTIEHDIRMYPVNFTLESEIMVDVDPEKYSRSTVKAMMERQRGVHTDTANNEPEFLELLKKIFSAKKTREIIAAILAQSKA